MELERFLDRLEGVTGGPDQFYSMCPAHEDRSPSLSVTEGADGRIYVVFPAGTCQLRVEHGVRCCAA
jgi:hypothetical protein